MMDGSQKRTILFVTAATSFLVSFMGSAVNIALPAVGGEFAMNAVVLAWVAMAYLLAASVLLVPFGRFSDLKGRRGIFLVGIAVFSFASLCAALSPGSASFIAARFLQGVGGAMMFGTNVAILMDVYPASERGRVLGIIVATVYLGLSLGPSAGGMLTAAFGWRSIFLLTAVTGGGVLAAASGALPGKEGIKGGGTFDMRGSVLYAASMAALMYGLSRLSLAVGYIPLGAGAAGLVLFIWRSSRMKHPVLDVNLFLKNRVFALSNAAALINYSATFATSFLLSLYLQYLQGMSPRSAGLVIMVQPVMQMVFSPFAGRLSDRKEPRIVASAGMAMTAGGLLFFAFLGPGTPVAAIGGALALLGFGFALFSSPNTNAVMSSVEKRSYGIASGILATMRLTGQMASMALTTFVFAIRIGPERISPANYPQFLQSARLVFAILTFLCVTGIFASLARGSMRRRDSVRPEGYPPDSAIVCDG